MTAPTTPKRFGLHPVARLLPLLLTRIVAGTVGLHGVIIPTLVPLFALRYAQAQTVPAAGAPSGQKAIMDAARNGVPIANIAPPSAAGVSRNQFTQFNVNTNGLILNNSAGTVQTQLGGWINGNMQLGLVPARVIVNEVVGPNASVLRGAMEVAGPGANIITANPNGLTCDGCSFINTTGRVSLTTGVPQYGANGAVIGFNVPQGVLTIGAGGLSAADLDQLDLIARGIIVAGTVTVNRLNVVAGANQVTYDSLVATTIAGTGAPPSFAVDIKDAGGMYAGQIWLIATEKGLGVNSTGRMSAMQGDLVLSSNGDLTYKDGYAKNALTLTAAGNTTITGQVQADGAAGGSVAITTGGKLSNNGTLYSATGLALNAASITSTGGSIQAQGDVSLTAQSLQLQGTSVGSNANLNLTASAGDITSSGSTLFAVGGLQANATGQVSNSTGQWQSGRDMTITAATLSNTGGAMLAQGQLTITSTAALNNTGGTLVAGTSANISAAALNNTNGIVSANDVRLSLGAPTTPGPLTNTGGQIIGTTSLALQAGPINNASGQIATAGALSLNTQGGTLNNAGGVIQAGGALTLTAGALDNTTGQLQSGADLSLTAAAANNTQGRIQSANRLSLTAAALNNTSGLITAASTLDATTAGTLGNAGGTIAAAGAVTLTLTNASNGAALTNTGGTIASTTGALTLATHGASLANDGGRLQALGDIRIDAGGTSNTGGNITGQTVNLTTGALNNSAGAIAAAAGLTLSTQALNNDAGLITAAGDITIDTHGQTLTNTRSATPVAPANGTAGGIAAGGALTLATGALNNTTGTLDASDITVNAASLNNTQGAIRAAHTASLSAIGAVTNTSGTVDATDITVSAASLDNTSGAIRAAGNASVTTSTLNNNTGLLSAKGTLNITAPSLSNTGGTLTGDAGLTLATGSAALSTTLDGTLGSNAGVTLTIAGDYNNAGTLSTQGSLTLNARDVSNSGTLHADAALTANVRDLSNTGEISSQTTTINAAGTVTNSGAGLIDGTTTTVRAAAVHNTGRIYGDTLTLIAPEISNDGAGVIAARDSLLIATQNLSNTNGALIYAINDIQLGGSYDATSKTVSGSAASVTNTYARIEAGRDLALSALAINNLNAGVTTTVAEVSRQPGKDYQSDNGGAFHTDTDWFVSGATPAPCNPTGGDPLSYSLNGFKPYTCGTNPTVAYTKANPTAWGTRAYANVVDTNTVTASDYTSWGVTAPGPQATQTETDNAIAAVNRAIVAYNLSVEGDYGVYGCCHYNEYNYTQVTRNTQLVSSQPAQILSGRDMTLTGTTVNNVSQIVAGAALTIVGPTVVNQDVHGTSEADTEDAQVRLVTPAGPGAWQPYTRPPVINTLDLYAYTYLQNSNQTTPYGVARSTTVGAPAAAANANNHPVAAGPVPLPVIQITPVSGTGATGLVVLTMLPALTAPSSALFTQHADAGAKYLIETDPRFTNQKTFLSSDYYLAQLNQDPERGLKRYGDGFFEQKEINDQILALTGRRYLANYTSTEAEYQALMDAGVAFAKAFQIAPGVTLSAEQMALLTTDVVLLTQQTVTLADGSTQQVLVPQVYLRKVQDGDLTQSAGLISGRNVTITTAGDLVNSGQITADGAHLSAGNDLVNTGRVEANVVVASATRDLSNLGGVITGTGNNSQVSLQAGRDILLRTTTNSATVSGPNGAVSSVTNIDRVATISGESIQLIAGRDVVVAGASVNATGALTLNAVRDVAITGVATSQSSQTIMDAKTHSNSSSTQDVGSAVSAGSDIKVTAGQDIAVKGSALQSTNGAINANAGRDITITEGRQTATTDFARETKTSGFLSSSTTTVKSSSAQDSAIGSSIGGTSVNLQSGNNINLQGASVTSTGATTINAQNDVNIVAAQNTQSASDYRAEKKSGLSVSLMNGISYGTSAGTQNQAQQSTTQVASTVSGANVTIQSGRDTQVTASSVLADQDITVNAGRNVLIGAAANSQASQQDATSSSTTIGLAPGLSGRFTAYGQNSMAQNGNGTAVEQSTSLLSANSGNLSIMAGTDAQYKGTGQGNVTTQGADLLAKDSVTVIGNAVDLQAAQNSSSNASHFESKSVTVGSALTGSIGGGITRIGDMVNEAQHTDDKRLQGALALKAGYDAYKLATNAPATIDASLATVAPDASSGPGIGVSVSIGTSKSRQDASQSTSTARGTNVQAQTISIQARDANIDGQAVRLQAQDISLDAAGQINLGAAQNTAQVNSSNQSSSSALGATLAFGGTQNGLSFQVSASQAKGQANGSETTYDNSQVTAAGTLTLKSGGDTNLKGAQLAAGTVKADIGGNLNIETLQDQSSYQSQQKSSGFDVSLCIPPICGGVYVTGSVNEAKQTLDHNYQSATGQSGIAAGAGGFDINVAGNTDLKGAAITSSAAKPDNKLQTGSLTYSDLANSQNTSASSSSTSLGYNGLGSAIGALANNITSNALSQLQSQAGQPKSGSQSGVTQSVISPADITITGGGAASQQNVATLTSRDASTANGALKNTLTLQQAQDLQAQQKKQQEDQRAAELIGAVITNVIGDIAQQEKWADGSTRKLVLHGMAGLIQAKVSGGSALAGIAGGVTQEALAPVLASYLQANGVARYLANGDTNPDFTALMQAGATLAGAAVGAVAGGNNGAATGASVALTGVTNNFLKHDDVALIATKFHDCGKDQTCKDKVVDEAYATSTQNDIALLNCKSQNNCDQQKAEFRKGYADIQALIDAGVDPNSVGRILNVEDNAQAIIRGKLDQRTCTTQDCIDRANLLLGVSKGLVKITPAGLIGGMGLVTYELTSAIIDRGLVDTAAAVATGIGNLPANLMAALTSSDQQVKGEALVDAMAISGVGAIIAEKVGIKVTENLLTGPAVGGPAAQRGGVYLGDGAKASATVGRGVVYENPSSVVQSRVDELLSQIPENSQGRITMGVAVVEDANGIRSVLVSTSEPRGYLRPGITLQPGETVIAGTGHAEADIVSFANANGLKIIDIGATRPVCGSCQNVISQTGANVTTPLKSSTKTKP